MCFSMLGLFPTSFDKCKLWCMYIYKFLETYITIYLCLFVINIFHDEGALMV